MGHHCPTKHQLHRCRMVCIPGGSVWTCKCLCEREQLYISSSPLGRDDQACNEGDTAGAGPILFSARRRTPRFPYPGDGTSTNQTPIFYLHCVPLRSPLKPKHNPASTSQRMKSAMPLEITAPPFCAQPVPNSLRKSFEKLDAALWIAVSTWMKRHGKVPSSSSTSIPKTVMPDQTPDLKFSCRAGHQSQAVR